LQTLLLHACPLPGPIEGVTAWTMTRVFTGQGTGYTRLLGGLGVLLASVLASAGWMTHLLLTWSRKLGKVEATVGRHEGLDPPLLEPTGERELDRIIASFNSAALKVRAMRQEAEALSAQVVASERLAALGRVAAGIAHEIRNPIAAMRLKAENALLSDDARRRAALEMMLGQIGRLDILLQDLLALTHRSRPRWQRADVPALLMAVAELHRDVAGRSRVELRVAAPAMQWELDPDRIRRALDNLVLNAVQSMPGGRRRHHRRRRRRRRAPPAGDGQRAGAASGGAPAPVRAVRDRTGGRDRSRPVDRAGDRARAWRRRELPAGKPRQHL